jgi:predicted CXXCH cytochrome family protein
MNSTRQASMIFGLIAAVIALLAANDAMSQQSFDHFSTGFVLDGAHASVTCESCHASGTFAPTSSICSSCHSQSGIVRASSMPSDHIATNGQCSNCHITADWGIVNFVDHASLTGSCINCHNGAQATGKNPNHISSNDQCDDCHSTTGWLPARFDHSGIVGNCVSCHDGSTATGKSAAHIQTSNVCEDCHNTFTFLPAFTVDHTQVIGTCGSCHDGSTATGKHPTHITSGINCERRRPDVRIVAILADVGCLNMRERFASCFDAVVAANAVAGDIDMIEIGW